MPTVALLLPSCLPPFLPPPLPLSSAACFNDKLRIRRMCSQAASRCLLIPSPCSCNNNCTLNALRSPAIRSLSLFVSPSACPDLGLHLALSRCPHQIASRSRRMQTSFRAAHSHSLSLFLSLARSRSGMATAFHCAYSGTVRALSQLLALSARGVA